jgi:kynurenine 3-monooxygenase
MSSPLKKEKKKIVVIVGAGLVGSLAALYFAEAGWAVHLFELREGMFI